MPETSKDVIEAAIDLEQQGRRFYLDLAERTKNEQLRRVYNSLADDELSHLNWIKELAPGQVNVDALNRACHERLCSIFQGLPDTAEDPVSMDTEGSGFRLAIKMEEEAYAAYMKWAESVDDPEVAEVCRQIAKTESFHIELLNNTLKYLDNTIDWFMDEEKWSFDGGGSFA